MQTSRVSVTPMNWSACRPGGFKGLTIFTFIMPFTILSCFYFPYSVTIEACTPGGCTESSPTLAQTDPYFPEGQAPPRGDPITQTYISVIWSPPSRPNGPGIRYDLYRMKVRQPLETGKTMITFDMNFEY